VTAQVHNFTDRGETISRSAKQWAPRRRDDEMIDRVVPSMRVFLYLESHQFASRRGVGAVRGGTVTLVWTQIGQHVFPHNSLKRDDLRPLLRNKS